MKSPTAYANRAWRKATKNWGMSKKKHRSFCRENALNSIECTENVQFFENQKDADYEVAEELTYWND
ncbi:MAG: hypothetical protein [Caudoviricetes sp.]|nr:MAG: hypothetical protein [Caudoviricetes sp.]